MVEVFSIIEDNRICNHVGVWNRNCDLVLEQISFGLKIGNLCSPVPNTKWLERFVNDVEEMGPCIHW